MNFEDSLIEEAKARALHFYPIHQREALAKGHRHFFHIAQIHTAQGWEEKSGAGPLSKTHRSNDTPGLPLFQVFSQPELFSAPGMTGKIPYLPHTLVCSLPCRREAGRQSSEALES